MALGWHSIQRPKVASVAVSPVRRVNLQLSLAEIHSISEFEALLQRQLPLVVVGFQKASCKPCRKVAPEFEAMAQKYSASSLPVHFFRVDAEENHDALRLFKHLNIKAVPCFGIYLRGQRVEMVSGAHIDELQQNLDDLRPQLLPPAQALQMDERVDHQCRQ